MQIDSCFCLYNRYRNFKLRHLREFFDKISCSLWTVPTLCQGPHLQIWECQVQRCLWATRFWPEMCLKLLPWWFRITSRRRKMPQTLNLQLRFSLKCIIFEYEYDFAHMYIHIYIWYTYACVPIPRIRIQPSFKYHQSTAQIAPSPSKIVELSQLLTRYFDATRLGI